MTPIRSQADLIAAIKGRRASLGWSQITLDAEAGLPEGYTSKLETSSNKPHARSIGWESLPKILAALGLDLSLNGAMLTAAKHQQEALTSQSVPAGLCISVSDYFSTLGKKGGERRRDRLGPQRRSTIARRAARARWGKVKARCDV